MRAIPLAVVLFLLYVTGAEAHARYVRSEPGQEAIVASAPERVDIWFTQELFRRQGENWIHVFGPGGELIHAGDAQIDDDDRRHMWVQLQSAMAPGEYRVVWRNLSAEDADDDEGEYSFTLNPQAQVTSTPMLADTETSLPTPTHTAIVTESVTTPTPGLTDETPSSSNDSEGGCTLGLTPVFALVALGFGLSTRRR